MNKLEKEDIIIRTMRFNGKTAKQIAAFLKEDINDVKRELYTMLRFGHMERKEVKRKSINTVRWYITKEGKEFEKKVNDKSRIINVVKNKNTIKVSDKNESTRSPFWIIIDPDKNLHLGSEGIHNIAAMITGVWFSRESAEEFLNRTRYNFSKHAAVYCHSGCYSDEWEEAIKNGEKE